MSAVYWIAAIGAVSAVTFALFRRQPEPQPVSSEWIRQQIRERGVKGWSGAYHEDE